MFFALLKTEHMKLYRRRVFWVMTGIIGGILLVLMGGLALSMANADEPTTMATTSFMENFDSMAEILGPQALGGILIAVLVSMFVANDYQWRTAGMYVRQGVPRLTVVAAKITTLLLATFAFVLISMTMVLAANIALYALLPDQSVTFVAADIPVILESVLQTTFALFPAAALAMFVTTLTRSMAAGIGMSIGYLLVVETFLPSVVALIDESLLDMVKYLPGQLAVALQGTNSLFFTGAEVPITPLSPAVAAVGIGIYVMLFAVGSSIIFRRQDL